MCRKWMAVDDNDGKGSWDLEIQFVFRMFLIVCCAA
jgi:hypothetical protein